jgi:peptide/nickel transport system ATP-binding protein/peptide/nickel transport system permease protein
VTTAAATAEVERPGPTARRRSAWFRAFLGTPSAAFGTFVLAVILFVAVFGPSISPFDPREVVARPYSPPSATHWLGTNDIGQDIFSEILWGTRVSLLIGLIAATAAVVVGTTVGVVASLAGGWVDQVLMRITDVVLTLPFLPLAVVLAAFLGPSLWNTALVIALVIWSRPARVVRSQGLAICSHAYVEAAHALGGRFGHVLWRHVVPGVVPIAVSQFILATSGAILTEASLAFLGLGDPIQKSWGTVLYYAQARGAFLNGSWPWWVLPPGMLIACTVLGFALIGRSLEGVLMPRLRQH